MTWKNSASHSELQTRTAWIVSTAAEIDGQAGTLITEFTIAASAKRAGEATEVQRDHFDWKPRTMQWGTDRNGRSVRGRWTGRMFEWKLSETVSFTDVELKVDGELIWVSP